MVKHKAAHDITFAPTEEKEGLSLWMEEHWRPLAALVGAIAVAILAWQFVRQRGEAAKDDSWNRLNAVLASGGATGSSAAAKALEPLTRELAGTPAGPWALVSLAMSHAAEEHYAEAEAALARLRKEYPDHLLATERFEFGEGVQPRNLVEQLGRLYSDQEAFRAELPRLFENPAPPADAPRVRIRTDLGDLVVALYRKEAPLHVENFLKLCGEGFYDGTLFHRVLPEVLIEGGDPNSRAGLPETWGEGGPEYTLTHERNELAHFAGALGSAKKSRLDEEENGSQFYIAVEPLHVFDSAYTVFGAVVEGLDVAKDISRGQIATGSSDRPESPVKILGTEVL